MTRVTKVETYIGGKLATSQEIPYGLNHYQIDAFRTYNEAQPTEYYLLQLLREAGELAEPYIKGKYHKHGNAEETKAKMKAELGDVLWFVAGIASNMGCTLEEIADMNIKKLEERYPDGYTDERSINRNA